MYSKACHILRLLWAPHRLAEAAITVPVSLAILASFIAIELIFILLFVGALSFVDEPFASFRDYVSAAVQATLMAAVMGGVLAGFVGGWVSLLALIAEDQCALEEP